MNWPKKSIEGKIRKSLLGYTIFIVVLLWTFQICLYQYLLQTMQRRASCGPERRSSAASGRKILKKALKASL